MTTAALTREISALKELFVTRLEGNDKAIVLLQQSANRSPTVNEVNLQHEERFKAITQQFVERDTRYNSYQDNSKEAIGIALAAAKEIIAHQNKMIELLRADLKGQADDARTGLTNLQHLHEEKFSSIAVQFKERDTRSERESRDNKLAVDAAFAAQEKQAAAQNKSNAEAIGKSELGTAETINKLSELTRTQIAGQSDKIDDLKERQTAIEARSKGSGDMLGYIVGGLGVIATVAMAIIMVVALKGGH